MGRLERADENRACDADVLAHEVQAPVDPVRAVDVRVAGRSEHRRVPLGLPPVAVRGGVLVVIGLDLDDPAAHAVHQKRGADQLRRDFVDGPGEEVTADLHSS